MPEAKGGFCKRGGRFGPHSSSESFAPIFYGKLVFVENDERGLVYLADRANTGLHIVRLTGEAAKIAGGN